jgi:hypothetical protein
MKLYRVEIQNLGTNTISIHWVGTQADAKAKFQNYMGSKNVGDAIVEVDVPTDKAGLLAFLNKNIKTEPLVAL